MKPISVIIPAHNEEKYLEPTLQSVIDQNHPTLELIVVPNGCTDKTAEIAEKYTSLIYDTTDKSISRAKNIGFEKANSEIIVFLDADTQMQPGLLAAIETSLEDKYLAGKCRVLPDDDSFGARTYFNWVNICGQISQITTYLNPNWNNGAGACIFSTHDLLSQLRKEAGYVFKPELKVMEDVNLISRLRAQGPFKYQTNPATVTSTRRFQGEGYLKRFFLDFVEYLNPEKIEQRMDH